MDFFPELCMITSLGKRGFFSLLEEKSCGGGNHCFTTGSPGKGSLLLGNLCWLPGGVEPLDGARASPGDGRLLNPLVPQAGTGLQAKVACWGKSRGEKKNEHWDFKGDWAKSDHICHMQSLSGPHWFPRGAVGTTCCTRGRGHKLKQIYEIPSECKKILFNYEGGEMLEQAMESLPL